MTIKELLLSAFYAVIIFVGFYLLMFIMLSLDVILGY